MNRNRENTPGLSRVKPANPTKRRIVTFEPCGPVLIMLENELRSGGRGKLRRVIEECIIAALGSKYPKIAERYAVLKEEGAL